MKKPTKNMKIAILCTAAALAVVAGVLLYPAWKFRNAKDIETTLHIDFSKVDYVNLRAETQQGPAGTEISEKETLREFLNTLKGDRLLGPAECPSSTGGGLAVSFYSGSGVRLGGFTCAGSRIVTGSTGDGRDTVYTGSKWMDVAHIRGKYGF